VPTGPNPEPKFSDASANLEVFSIVNLARRRRDPLLRDNQVDYDIRIFLRGNVIPKRFKSTKPLADALNFCQNTAMDKNCTAYLNCVTLCQGDRVPERVTNDCLAGKASFKCEVTAPNLYRPPATGVRAGDADFHIP
jgi:hypothetical protein